jgi:hypothetical protein
MNYKQLTLLPLIATLAGILVVLGTKEYIERKNVKLTVRCETQYGKGSTVVRPSWFSSPQCRSMKDGGQLKRIPGE